MLKDITEITKWDNRFLSLAAHIALWSKDPGHKVGAVLTKDKQIISAGYNGFPREILDYPERYDNRDTKLKLIVHAEINALLYAANTTLEGLTLYVTPFMPCSSCTKTIIQFPRKILKIVSYKYDNSNWNDEMEWSRLMLQEANIELVEYLEN